MFVKKRDEKNEALKDKAHFVAPRFIVMFWIDYDKTYSPIMEMQLINVVITHLFKDFD